MTLTTAGESHGPCLVVIVSGFPAGVLLDESVINEDLKMRQGGYGRGGRMQIESDRVSVLSGIRKKTTIGSPVCLKIENRDYKIDILPNVTKPRPGHADLSGVMKYGQDDIRNILERASARETAARVAAGSLAKVLLSKFGISVLGYVKGIGGVDSCKTLTDKEEIRKRRDKSRVYCLDESIEKEIIEKIDVAKKSGDSLGGIIEVVSFGLPTGLGDHVHWDLRLDGAIARALMSIQGIKGVEFGLGFQFAGKFGSQVHDEITYDPQAKESSLSGGFGRSSNNAGGIEGGMSNGEVLISRAVMKPIPTLMKPLKSIDILSKEPTDASTERSDTCAVPAASIVAESVVSFEIARSFLEKFGGDSLCEITRNYHGYLRQIRKM
ncbi:MAG: chorismate synthase [Candidatus Scalindua sp. SCAELEC01]|nr:MAG: chorismate synthase [Candidatus Scalindua sp. SCAELEC01]